MLSPNTSCRSEADAVCPRERWTYQTAHERLYGVVPHPSMCPPQNLPWSWHDRPQRSAGLRVVQAECRAEEALLWSSWQTERHAQAAISWYERQQLLVSYCVTWVSVCSVTLPLYFVVSCQIMSFAPRRRKANRVCLRWWEQEREEVSPVLPLLSHRPYLQPCLHPYL